MCPLTEARILAECITRADVFADLDDFGVDHFAVPQHRVVWAAMRHLQSIGESVCILAIADAIELRDLEHGTEVAAKVNVSWLADLLCTTTNYGHEVLFDHDVWWLRELADRRHAIRGAA